MTVMNSEVYDALLDAGATEGKARAAASAIADQNQRFMSIEANFMILKWMIGFNLAFSVAIAFQIFF